MKEQEEGYVVEGDGGGKKGDGGKLRYDLLQFDVLQEKVKVLTFGANKYSDNNWKLLEEDRIIGAIFRHLIAHLLGELRDKETGLLHLSHAECEIDFLTWRTLQKIGDEK